MCDRCLVRHEAILAYQKEKSMAIQKYGTGEVLGPDNDELKKTAKPDWTEDDEKELEKENGVHQEGPTG